MEDKFMSDRFRVRAWDEKNKRYCYDVQNLMFDISDDLDTSDDITLLDAVSRGLVDELKLEQCTGLEDINGNPIYENDIVECVDDTIKFVGTIKYCAYFFGFFVKRKHRKFGLGTVPYTKLKVIGNVRNNPELLEVNNEK